MPARRSTAAWVLLALTTLVCLSADLVTKHLAFAHIAGVPVVIDRGEVLATDRLGALIPAHEPVVAVPKLLDLTLVLNPGAVFGIGSGQRWFFVVFTIAAMGLCVWMFGWWTGRRDRLAHIAIGCVLGGGLGNLYDRLQFACVRDFLHPLPGMTMPFGLSWPGSGGAGRELWPYVSNVADALLIVGIAALIFHSLRKPHEFRPTGQAGEQGSQAEA